MNEFLERRRNILIIVLILALGLVIYLGFFNKKEQSQPSQTKTTAPKTYDNLKASNFTSQQLIMYRLEGDKKEQVEADTFKLEETKERVRVFYRYSDATDDTKVRFVVFNKDTAKEVYSTLDMNLPKDKTEYYFLLNIPDVVAGNYFVQAIDVNGEKPLQIYNFKITE